MIRPFPTCWLCGNLGRSLCPHKWEWNVEFQKCYYINEELLNWDDANNRCDELWKAHCNEDELGCGDGKATLAPADCRKENDHLIYLASTQSATKYDKVYPWIGGKNVSGEWTWIGGSKFDPDDPGEWYNDEPDGDGDCLWLGGFLNDGIGNWHDGDCASTRVSICSKKPDIFRFQPDSIWEGVNGGCYN